MPERAPEERQEAAGSPEPAAVVMNAESREQRRAGLPASAWVWAVGAVGAAAGLILFRGGRELAGKGGAATGSSKQRGMLASPGTP